MAKSLPLITTSGKDVSLVDESVIQSVSLNPSNVRVFYTDRIGGDLLSIEVTNDSFISAIGGSVIISFSDRNNDPVYVNLRLISLIEEDAGLAKITVSTTGNSNLYFLSQTVSQVNSLISEFSGSVNLLSNPDFSLGLTGWLTAASGGNVNSIYIENGQLVVEDEGIAATYLFSPDSQLKQGSYHLVFDFSKQLIPSSGYTLAVYTGPSPVSTSSTIVALYDLADLLDGKVEFDFKINVDDYYFTFAIAGLANDGDKTFFDNFILSSLIGEVKKDLDVFIESASSGFLIPNEYQAGRIINVDRPTDTTVSIQPGLVRTIRVEYVKKGAGNIIFSAGIGVTIQSIGTTLATQNTKAELIHEGSDVWSIYGNLT